MKKTGIPTVYKGIQFRSRLEARWAAFFDLCGWHWKYEPVDLPGYIPDFIVYRYVGKSEDTAYQWNVDLKQFAFIEVKPTDTLDEEAAEKAIKATNTWCCAGNPSPLALCQVGNGPFRSADTRWFPQLGWVLNSVWCVDLGTQEPYGHTSHYWGGMFGYHTSPNGVRNGELFSHAVTFNNYHDEEFLFGSKPGICDVHEDSPEYVEALWAKAGNITQWKGAQNNGGGLW